MANEVVKKSAFGGKVSVANIQALAEQMDQSAAIGARPEGDYISFSGKRGVYEIGSAKRPADPAESWLVNVAGFEDGYICWKGGAVMAKRMFPMGVQLPPLDKSEHGPFIKDGDGWYDAKAMVLRSIDTGQQGYFSINSASGLSEFSDLQREITARIRTGEAFWPVINLSAETFTAKGFKNSKPKLLIEGWLNDDAVAKMAELMEDPEANIDMDELYTMSGRAPVAIEPPTKKNRRGL